MLTKELLKFHIRQDKLVPQFVKRPFSDDLTSSLKQVEKLLSQTLSDDTKNRRKYVETAVFDSLADVGLLQEGFAKIFSDYFCEYYEPSEDIRNERWEMFKRAEKIRKGIKNFAEFEQQLAAQSALPLENLRAQLYSDLEDYQKLKAVKPVIPDQFINRYNVALVQGALWFAKDVTISFAHITQSDWRFLLQKFRYFHLLAEIKRDEAADKWTLNLSGPLALFEHVQAYAMKVANFFPHILSLKNWKLVAEVKWKNRMTTLILDEKSGLANPYQNLQSYIPEEFSSIHAAFEKKATDWKLLPWGEPVHFFEGEYITPDWKAVHSSGKEVLIEIFHKWHAAGLNRRLPHLDKMKNLCLTYSKALGKDLDLKKYSHADRVFEFKDFPTATALDSALKKFEI